MKGTATISENGLYRYDLTRRWGDGDPLVWVMLNPSTADATEDDATIRRVVNFTRRFGHNALVVVNLFALRTADPKELRWIAGRDPVGPDNDEYLKRHVANGNRVVAAWGAIPTDKIWRAMRVARTAPELWCLALTKYGEPRHPLYVRANADLRQLNYPVTRKIKANEQLTRRVTTKDCPLTAGKIKQGFCHWCGKKLTGQQKKWCSRKCNDSFGENHWWGWARNAAIRRDKRCLRCHTSPERVKVWWIEALGATEFDFWNGRRFEDLGQQFREELTAAELEVHHKQRIRGRHSESGCHHHLDGLETLCHACHLVETKRQNMTDRVAMRLAQAYVRHKVNPDNWLTAVAEPRRCRKRWCGVCVRKRVLVGQGQLL